MALTTIAGTNTSVALFSGFYILFVAIVHVQLLLVAWVRGWLLSPGELVLPRASRAAGPPRY